MDSEHDSSGDATPKHIDRINFYLCVALASYSKLTFIIRHLKQLNFHEVIASRDSEGGGLRP